MKNLFLQIKNSLSKSHIYKDPENQKAGPALKYIAVLVIVVAVIQTVLLSIFFIPALYKFKEFALEAVAKYPADLVLTLKGGELSMNRPNPYLVPIKEDEKKIFDKNRYENIVVIDTDKSLDFMAYESYKTAILITKNGFIVEKENGGIEAQTFKKFPDYVLSKTSIDEIVNKFDNFISTLPTILIVLMVILTWILISIGSYISALFLSLLGTLVVLVTTKIKGYSLSFSNLFALSLYGYTSVILLGIIKIFFPFSGWISFVVFVILFSLLIDKKNSQPKPVENNSTLV